jgi:hypothetical protein
MERALRDTRINRIVEGTTDIMHLFLAREALDGHLRNAGGLFKKGASLWDKIKVVGKCALVYPKWYAKMWIGSILNPFTNFDNDIQDELSWIESRTRRLARDLFHQMLLRGPKLEMRQLILGRIVDIGAELAVMGLVAARIQTERRRTGGVSSNDPVALYFFRSRRKVVDGLFDSIWDNADDEARRASEYILRQTAPFNGVPRADLPALDRKFCSDYTK